MAKSERKWIRGILALISGILLFGVGVYEGVESYIATHYWERAEGRITHLEKSRGRRGRITYKPHFTFRTNDAHPISYSGKATAFIHTHSVNEKVKVLYPADNPNRAVLDDFSALWGFPLVFLGLGALFAWYACAVHLCLFGRKQEEEEPETDEAPVA